MFCPPPSISWLLYNILLKSLTHGLWVWNGRKVEKSSADRMKLRPQRPLKETIFLVILGGVHFETCRKMTEPLAWSIRLHKHFSCSDICTLIRTTPGDWGWDKISYLFVEISCCISLEEPGLGNELRGRGSQFRAEAGSQCALFVVCILTQVAGSNYRLP